MAKRIIWSGSTTLPAPTSLSVNDEIIWSSDTGRTLSGRMVGDPVAQKKTVSLKWEYLTEAEEKIIKNTKNLFVSTKKNKMGHGIGLTLVKRVLEKYDGFENIEYDTNYFVFIAELNEKCDEMHNYE